MFVVICFIFIILNIFITIETFALERSDWVDFKPELQAENKDLNPDDYNPGTLTQKDTEVAFAKTGIILGAIKNFSIVASVIVLMIIGLKNIFGSVEEKANYKATMLPYIIGCIMAATGTTLVSFIYNAFN